jgi:carbon starvation protein CstA
MVVLWTITIYLLQSGRFFWVTLIPAFFMTAVCVSYILFAPEGFSLPGTISHTVGIVAAVTALAAFLIYKQKLEKTVPGFG